MNRLTALWRKATYRTGPGWARDPHACSLHVTPTGWAGRAVDDPALPVYLHRRRVRLLRDGLDRLDRAMLDADTIDLLAATAASLPSGDPARYVAAYLAKVS